MNEQAKPKDDRRDRFVWGDGDLKVKRPRSAGPRTIGLGTLRRSRRMSQEEVAERLGVKQGHVSRLEHRADAKLSTVVNYLESVGGREVELTVTFEDGERVSLPLRGDH